MMDWIDTMNTRGLLRGIGRCEVMLYGTVFVV